MDYEHTVKLQWTIRLSFLVLPPLPAPSKPPRINGALAAHHGRAPSIDMGTRASLGLDNAAAAHTRSKSFAFGSEPIPLVDPVSVPTGSHHIMPIPSETNDLHTAYRAVPDLAFTPVLFQSAADAATALAVNDWSPTVKTIAAFSTDAKPDTFGSAVALMPAKTETIECAIPIRVYPASTREHSDAGWFSCADVQHSLQAIDRAILCMIPMKCL